MSRIEVLNDPTHKCHLPDPAKYPPGTDISCREPIVGGRGLDSICGRRYTRTTTFWTRTPRWRDYDWGW